MPRRGNTASGVGVGPKFRDRRRRTMTSWKTLACGLLGCVLVLGCGKPAEPTKADVKKEDEDDHDHGPGPHRGLVIEVGKHHAEFCMDHATKTATVYILDGRVKNAVPIAASKVTLSIKSPAFVVDAAASPQEGDPAGKASRFVAVHENFGKEQEFAGTLVVEIDGKRYSEDFEEKAHAHDKKK
jgi:hypothetical protein